MRSQCLRIPIFAFVVVLGSLCLGQSRPGSLILAEKAVLKISLENIVYAAGTPDDLSQPASGTTDVVIGAVGQTKRIAVCSFSGLKQKADKSVDEISLTTSQDTIHEDLLTSSIDLSIPKGTVMQKTAGQFKFIKPAVGKPAFLMPMKNSEGARIRIEFDQLTATSVGNGFDLIIVGGHLSNTDLSSGINLGFGTLRSTAIVDVTVNNPGDSAPVKWLTSLRTVSIKSSIPGLATKEKEPIEAIVDSLSINQDGNITCSRANAKGGLKVECQNPTGFELTIREPSSLEFRDGIPIGFTLSCDLKLPPDVTDSDGDRIEIKGITLNASDESGLTVQVTKPLDLVWKGLTLHADDFGLDLSNTKAFINIPTGAPAEVKDPSFCGLYIRQGKIELPTVMTTASGNPIRVRVQNFLVESKGITGIVTIQGNIEGGQIESIGGFDAQNVGGSLTFKRNQITDCDLTGDIKLKWKGAPASDPGSKFGVGLQFGDDGFFSVEVRNNEKLEYKPLGIEITLSRGQFIVDDGVAKIFVSGKLKFKNVPGIDGIPEVKQALDGTQISIKDFGFDSEGNIYLPSKGAITFGTPVVIDLKILKLEARSLGFETTNNELSAVLLSGGVDMGKDSGLPVSGNIDFEGLKIAKDGDDADSLPDISIGRLSVDLSVQEIMEASGTISYSNDKRFGPTFSGAAKLTIADMGGAGIKMLITPKAWFIGAGGKIPPVTVSLPPTPTSPPVPLFNIYGFFGGFGYGIVAKPGAGRISSIDQLDPLDNQVLMQAGLLLGDQATGNLWWGETTLTLGFPAVTVDLTGRFSFIDLKGPDLVDIDYWDQADRVASIYANLDLSKVPNDITFLVGGDLFFAIPTRKDQLVTLEGEALMKFSKNEAFIRAGWEKEGQRPLRLALGDMMPGVDLELKGGFNLDLRRTLFEMEFSGDLTVDAGISIDASVDGSLRINFPSYESMKAGTRGALELPEGTGKLHISGKAYFDDFPDIRATAYANLNVEFNTPRHRKELFVDGAVKGSIRVFGFKQSLSSQFSESLMKVK